MKGKNWTFENLYVGYSRITTNNGIRCLPLSQRFDRRKFLNLRPNINTTRWRMDTAKGNKWIKNPKSAELRDKVKKKESNKSKIKRTSPTNKSTRDKKQKNEVEVDKKSIRKRSSQKELSVNDIKKESPPKKTKVMNLGNEKKSTISKRFSQK